MVAITGKTSGNAVTNQNPAVAGITLPSDTPKPPELSPNQKIANDAFPEIDYPAMPSYYSSTCSIKQTSSVKPEEVCTIDQLYMLNVYDSKNYIKNTARGLTDLKTFNVEKDNKENRTKSFCKKNLKGDKANLNCLFEHGAGYVRKPGDPDTCIVYDCPPGFERNGNDCKKILLDAKIDKRAHCDERWSDWFMIPNYHLGNKYYSEGKGGTCYAPCPQGYVPYYATDPADGAKLDFTSSDKLNKCVARNIYFGGKYEEGSEYCPLAVIHRLTATPDSLNNNYRNLLKASASNISHNELYNTLVNNSKNIMTNMLNDSPILLEDISIQTQEMEMACANLNTTDRLSYAYQQCKLLKENEEGYKENLSKSDTSGAIDQKIIMIKQSCNSLFCPKTADADSTVFTMINKDMEKDKICFSKIGNVDPSKVKIKSDSSGNEIYPEDESPPDASDGEMVIYTAIWMFIYLILVPAGIVVAYYTIKYAIPYIFDIILLLFRIIVYIITLIIYILSFARYDLRPRAVIKWDDISPGFVNIMALKFEADNPETLMPQGIGTGAKYGRDHHSWRLFSRKWVED